MDDREKYETLIRRFCPLVSNPREECYCANLDSLNTAAAIRYCARDFKACEIYQECRAEKKSTRPATVGKNGRKLAIILGKAKSIPESSNDREKG